MITFSLITATILFIFAMYKDILGEWSLMPIILCALATLVSLLMLLSVWTHTTSGINEYYATKNTIATARASKTISEVELAALQTEIIKINSWLANKQYWNSTKIGDEYIPDDVDDLLPLK